MSERQQIQDAVQDKYGAIARARGAVGCCGPAPCGCGDPITSNLYSDEETGSLPGRGRGRLARVRKSHGAGPARARPDGARPRLGRRHRRAALGAAGGPDRKSVWSRRDRRDAGARPREPAPGGRHQRGVPQGLDRGDSASRRLGGRDHLELRHQPRRPTRTPRCARRFACSSPADGSRSRTWWSMARCRPRCAGTWSCGSAASPARCDDREYQDKLTAAGFADVSVEPWREYSLDDARTFLAAGGLDVDALSSQVEGKIASAFIRAQKPVPASCCAPGCCA